MWDFNPSLFINAPQAEWIYFGSSASLSFAYNNIIFSK